MSDTETIEAAKAAWLTIKGRSRATFTDWILVARALAIGRAACMAEARANSPAGSKYNRLMARWLQAHDLADVSPQERYRALWVLECLPEIEQWRASLAPELARRFNHPGSISAGWKRAQAGLIPCKPGPRRQAVAHAAPEPRPHQYTAGFHQDDLRLGGKEYLQCQKEGVRDIYVMLRRVYVAAGLISSRTAPTTRSHAALMPAAADILHAPERR